MHTCADCGVALVPGHYQGWWRDPQGQLTCRAEYDDADDLKPRLLWADYHYIDGEERRYWPANRHTRPH